jgi:hypothetical protein
MSGRLSEELLNFFVGQIKDRKDPEIIHASLSNSAISRRNHDVLHALFSQHDRLDASDIVYLAQSLSIKFYLEALANINMSASDWLRYTDEGHYEDPQAVANIQTFCSLIESLPENSGSLINTDEIFRGGHLLQLLARPDLSAKDQAEQFRKFEFRLQGASYQYFRNTYARTIVDYGATIDSSASQNDPRIKRFMHQFEIFKRLGNGKLEDFKTLQVILSSAGDPETKHNPLVENEIQSFGRACLIKIGFMDNQDRKEWFRTLLPDSVKNVRFVVEQAPWFNLDEVALNKLYISAFLTITNGNKRCAGEGVNDLVELLRPHLNWPVAIKRLDEVGMKVLIEHVKDKESYLKLIPRTARGKVLEDELGL